MAAAVTSTSVPPSPPGVLRSPPPPLHQWHSAPMRAGELHRVSGQKHLTNCWSLFECRQSGGDVHAGRWESALRLKQPNTNPTRGIEAESQAGQESFWEWGVGKSVT